MALRKTTTGDAGSVE